MKKAGREPDQDGEFDLDKEDFLNILQHPEATGLLNEVHVDVFGILAYLAPTPTHLGVGETTCFNLCPPNEPEKSEK